MRTRTRIQITHRQGELLTERLHNTQLAVQQLNHIRARIGKAVSPQDFEAILDDEVTTLQHLILLAHKAAVGQEELRNLKHALHEQKEGK